MPRNRQRIVLTTVTIVRLPMVQSGGRLELAAGPCDPRRFLRNLCAAARLWVGPVDDYTGFRLARTLAP
jgi:hypothetical protein